jgi:hypothetical protein
MANYAIDIRSPDGRTRLAYLDSVGIMELEYVLTENSPHAAKLVIPPGILTADALREDTRLYIYRQPIGANAYILEGQTCFLIQTIERTRDEITVSAVGAMDILSRRIVNYAAGSTQAKKTGFADEIMRLVLTENFGASATGTGREIPAALFNIPSQRLVSGNVVSAFPSISKAFAWDNVLSVFQEIAAACATAGTFMSFDVVAQGTALLGFQTWDITRGGDRRRGKTNAVILSEEAGNLVARIALSYGDSKTYIRAGGQGEGEDRELAEAIDTARVLASPWGRREAFSNASNSDTAGAVQDEADSQLWAGKPRLNFEGEIIETPTFRYGVEFSLGTLLTADTRGFSFECRMSNIHVGLGRDGSEKIDIKVAGETVI